MKLSSNDTRPFPSEVSSCELMPSGYNQTTTNISSRKCKQEKVRESYANITTWSKEVHESIEKKDDQLERIIDDSADFVIDLSVLAKEKASAILNLIFLNFLGL